MSATVERAMSVFETSDTALVQAQFVLDISLLQR